MSVTRNNTPSVADIIHYNLTHSDKPLVENYLLMHEVLLHSLKMGVSGDVLLAVADHIPKSILAEAIGTNINNLNRISKRMLKKYQTDVLIDLSSLWFELRQFFNFNETSVLEWINTPLPVLSGGAPGHLMITIAGRKQLRKLLDAMRSGDF